MLPAHLADNMRIANEDDITEIWDEVWLDPAIGELPMSREELKDD